jgi:hypothetical protein
VTATGSRIKVLNGTVLNFPAAGIAVGPDGAIENMTVAGCGTGVQSAATGITARNVTARSNQGHGILLGPGAFVEGCVATGNCVSVGNTAGIGVGARSTVQDCIANGNNSGAADTAASGILVTGNGCTIADNVGGVSGFGIFSDFPGNAVIGNRTSGHTFGIYYLNGTNQRCELNRLREAVGLAGAVPSSPGTGEFDNIVY